MKLTPLLILQLFFVGCASFDYGVKQPQYEGQVLSTSSIEGNLFYDSLVSAVKAEHPWNSGELESYGKPDYIFSQDITHCYLLYKDPVKVIFMDAPIVGDIKFSELDYIPDNFKSYLTDTAPTIDTSSFKQKLSQLELGMSLESFLKLFPDAELQEHKIDSYGNTGESFERRDYEYRYHSFVFSDGKLNSYRNKLSL